MERLWCVCVCVCVCVRQREQAYIIYLWRCYNLLLCTMLSRSVMSDSLCPHGLQPTRLPRPWGSPGKNTGVKVAQTCPPLCDLMDCSLQGSFVHGILQARIPKWVAFPFSRGSSQPRDWTQVLSHCRWVLYCLSHQRSPRILECVAYPFFRGSSQPTNQTRVSCIAGGFFTS